MALFRAYQPLDISRLYNLSPVVQQNSNFNLALIGSEYFFKKSPRLSTILGQILDSKDSWRFKIINVFGQKVRVLTSTISRGTIEFATTTSSILSVSLCIARFATILTPRLLILAYPVTVFPSAAAANVPNAVSAFPRWNRAKFLTLPLSNVTAGASPIIKRSWQSGLNDLWRKDHSRLSSLPDWYKRLNATFSASAKPS
ncbi:MAG: hypothetical protein UV47_C0010G0008 [Parcubacteria group bacterium GW2011_GWA2_42_80]|nr:MAG: hypothetical protein UV47_C0010G0008 [Parcubacteria group bacterium GW2011_GWA2_42_80]